MTDAPAYDPCAQFAILRDALNTVVAGGTVRKIRFRSGEDERETDFAPANISDLRRAMLQAREECSKSMTGRGTRFAIQGGSCASPYLRPYND